MLKKVSNKLMHKPSKLASALAGASDHVVHGGAGTLGFASSAHHAEASPLPGSLQKAMGEVRGINGMNAALWALGVFKHEPPKVI